jgi:hypothetical protein
MCSPQLPQHTAIISLKNTNRFVSTLQTTQWFLFSESSQPGQIAESHLHLVSDKNECSYISTRLYVFLRRAQAWLLPPVCHTNYITLWIHLSHFLLPHFKLTSPQNKGVIPVKVWNGITMYQFLLWPHNNI